MPWEEVIAEKCRITTVESRTANSQRLLSIHCVRLSWTFLIIPGESCSPLLIRWSVIQSIIPLRQTPQIDALLEKILGFL